MDIYECAICLNLLNDPKIILCGHTFCKKCLSELKPQQRRCPLCQTSFEELESVDSLPSNYIVKQWLDEMNEVIIIKPQIKNLKNSDSINFDGEYVGCENCEELPASYWCESCSPGIYYCSNCDSIVHSSKALRNHIRITIEEKKKKPSFTKCDIHCEARRFYCLDCNKVICSMCLVEEHPHKTTTIIKYAEKLKEDAKKKLDLFQLKIKDFDDQIQQISQNITGNEKRRQLILEELDQIDIDMRKHFNEKESIFGQKEKLQYNIGILSSYMTSNFEIVYDQSTIGKILCEEIFPHKPIKKSEDKEQGVKTEIKITESSPIQSKLLESSSIITNPVPSKLLELESSSSTNSPIQSKLIEPSSIFSNPVVPSKLLESPSSIFTYPVVQESLSRITIENMMDKKINGWLFPEEKQQIQPIKYSCAICNKDFIEKSGYDGHLRGQKHIKKMQTKNQKKAQIKNSNFYCVYCDKYFVDGPGYEGHLRGQKHIKNVQKNFM